MVSDLERDAEMKLPKYLVVVFTNEPNALTPFVFFPTLEDVENYKRDMEIVNPHLRTRVFRCVA